jgi:hypothetical protein
MTKEKGLNRVIVAACSPRTLEPLFRDTLREAGINPYYYEMANIREHDSWVHSKEKEEATQKAKDIILSVGAPHGALAGSTCRSTRRLVAAGCRLTCALSIAGRRFPGEKPRGSPKIYPWRVDVQLMGFGDQVYRHP